MVNIFIGVRAGRDKAKSVLERDPFCLNERASRQLRRAGRKFGIKGQEKGRRLHYYKIDESEYQLYTEYGMAEFLNLQHEADWRPLVAIAEQDLKSVYAEVNSRYPRRMPPAIYDQYQSEIVGGLARHLKAVC